MTQPSTNHILLVEDDRDIQETLRELLTEEGYDVAMANNGQEALTYLRTAGRRPDAILLDLMMPVMDGLQFREAQRHEPAYSGIPVVVLSADRNVGEKATQMAVAAYLEKPLNIDTLLDTLSGLDALAAPLS
jgi:two-component system chemotaxis response regulator CheY